MHSSNNSDLIVCVVGARPNFMKIAPIMASIKASDRLEALLVHTGQHYDASMKDAFFKQLQIPEPDIDLEVGSGSHAQQTAEIMKRFERVVLEHSVKAVLVVGDVNSTIACALVSVKMHIPVIHIEAGLRSNDRDMPEEINRILTDQISSLLFTTEQHALANLENEGIAADKVHFVGNVMIDTLLNNLPKAIEPAVTLNNHAIDQLASFALATLHRPSNVDDAQILQGLIDAFINISQRIPILLPLHPRTLKILETGELLDKLKQANIFLLPPLGYHEMLGLMNNAEMVLTDSGGIQEETTALGVPCLTLRENTERPITVNQGTNIVCGVDGEVIIKHANDILNGNSKAGRQPALWDGHAAHRIVAKIGDWLDEQ